MAGLGSCDRDYETHSDEYIYSFWGVQIQIYLRGDDDREWGIL